jgi:hypothetical protein
MVTEGERCPIRKTNAALSAEDQHLRAAKLSRLPPHADILTPAEKVAARTFKQLSGGQGKKSGRPGLFCHH